MRNLSNAPMYDERFVTPMRQELTRLGVEELRTAAEPCSHRHAVANGNRHPIRHPVA